MNVGICRRRSTVTWLLAAASALAIMPPALAQAQEAARPQAEEQRQSTPPAENARDPRNTIVVVGSRTIIASLRDVATESEYDEDAVAGYGANSVGELLDLLQSENGDDDPALLVNGRPVTNQSDISALPPEAVARIEVLPKGSATKIGGAPGQRAYNVVLRPSLKTATATASHERATEGGWSNSRGEFTLTAIKNQDRINLSLRVAGSDSLFESERNFVPRTEPTPFSAIGNIVPSGSTQVDPAFSALFGQPVTVIALQPNNANPTLASLLAGANRVNPSNAASYRTLRGPSRPIDINLSGNKQLNDWLSLAVSARLGWNRSENLSGLPSAVFTIPATNPFTPFATTTAIALNDPLRPLQSRSNSNSQSLSATLNAQRGSWQAALTAKWDRRESSYLSQFTGSLGTAAIIAPSVNPFAGTLAGTIPVTERTSTSRFSSGQVLFELQGPLFSLWAGPLNSRTSIGFIRNDYAAVDFQGPRGLVRDEFGVRSGVTIPLTSQQSGFLPELGESELDLDYGITDLGRFGKIDRRSIAFNWQPASWLRLTALDSREERAIVPELLAAPIVSTPNVPYFDPLTGQTTDVTLIFGGVPDFTSDETRNRSIGVTLTPKKAWGLQLNGEYAVVENRNQVGALPPASPAVVAAFPDRFIRNAQGFLTTVDTRSVNFDRQRSEVLRFGLRLNLPLSKPGAIVRDAKGGRSRKPQTRLSFSINHSLVLSNTALIRAGLPEVDLLAGGALGLGGGQPRHSTRANLSLTRGGTGLRLDFARRGASQLVAGTLAAPNLLRFDALSTLDIRAFANLDELLPKARLPRGTRLTLAVDNLFNQRQRVTDLSGTTPQAYQGVRRDPVGRTVMIELRTVF